MAARGNLIGALRSPSVDSSFGFGESVPEAAVAGTEYPALRSRLSISEATIASSSTIRTFVLVGSVMVFRATYVAKGHHPSQFFLKNIGRETCFSRRRLRFGL